MTNKNGTAARRKNQTLADHQDMQDHVISGLLSLPSIIKDLRQTAQERQQAYNARAARLAIEALAALLFPGKKPEDDKRAAANDTEREMAVKLVLVEDVDLQALRAQMESAQRELRCAEDKLKSHRLVARLALAGKGRED